MAHGKGSDLLMVTELNKGGCRRSPPLNFQSDALFTCSASLKISFRKVFTLLSFGSVRTPSVRGWQGDKEV